MPRRHANVHDEARDDPNAGDPVDGFTKEQLLEAGELSSKTFDMIRKAARVKGPAHGGLGFVFSLDDVVALVKTAQGGRFTERGGPAAKGWRTLPGVDYAVRRATGTLNRP